jgi:putative DNA primase/helicase
MRRDGSVLMAPGYDPVSQVYFHSALSDWEAPPARAAGAFDPIADPFIRAAKAEFEDLFGPFSPEEFKTDDGRPAADFSALVAAVLTALMRPELGPAPGFFIGAPTPASGKSFLAHIISIIATGREAPMMTLPQDDTALEDALFSSLRAADAIICIDNLEKPLVSQALNAMLTTPVFSRRVKGVHENQTVRPSMTTFILTGNNPQVWGDGTTRWLYPRINPCCERPQDRKFDRDPLVYTKANRKRLVWAGLTLLKGYADAGRPSQGVSSRFGVWSDWVRSCLMWAGFADPCLTMDRWTATDEVKSGLAALLESWFEKYQMVGTGMSRPRTCGDVIKDLCPNDEQLTNAIVGMAADSKGNPDPRRLGNKLKQWPGRIESGTSGLFRLVMCSAKKAGALQWQVEKVS